MTIDDVKDYIVCINGGSGVIFQPMDENYSYILTAKHVFDDLDDFEGLIKIDRYAPDAKGFTSITPFNLKEKINFFIHPDENMDIAIIITKRLFNHDKLIFTEENKTCDNLYLSGFPGRRRESNKPINIDSIGIDPIIEILHDKENNKVEAELRKTATHKELVGQSGGGIIKIDDENIYLMGIQNKIPVKDDKEQLGRIAFTPIKLFNEIINKSGGLLESLLPSYMKCFSFLKEKAFILNGGLNSQKTVAEIVEILSKKIDMICEENISPVSIMEILGEKSLLLHGQNKERLLNIQIWIVWLELLTILNIAKSRNNTFNDFQELFKEIRLFHSNTNGDFWANHLEDLVKSDFSELKKNGLVIVSSNIPAMDNLHELKSIPEKIDRPIRQNFAIDNINIDSPAEYPLKKFRFKNISVFKEKVIVQNYTDFENLEVPEQLNKLRELYEDIVNN